MHGHLCHLYIFLQSYYTFNALDENKFSLIMQHSFESKIIFCQKKYDSITPFCQGDFICQNVWQVDNVRSMSALPSTAIGQKHVMAKRRYLTAII